MSIQFPFAKITEKYGKENFICSKNSVKEKGFYYYYFFIIFFLIIYFFLVCMVTKKIMQVKIHHGR